MVRNATYRTAVPHGPAAVSKLYDSLPALCILHSSSSFIISFVPGSFADHACISLGLAQVGPSLGPERGAKLFLSFIRSLQISKYSLASPFCTVSYVRMRAGKATSTQWLI